MTDQLKRAQMSTEEKVLNRKLLRLQTGIHRKQASKHEEQLERRKHAVEELR